MPAKLQQYLLLMFHRRWFIFGLGLVLTVAIACEVLARTRIVWIDSQDWAPQLLGSFGDSLIIAFILALLVDPVAQHQFATEWGKDLYWAIFSPDAPSEFRAALQGLAAPVGYVSRCTYEVDLLEVSDSTDRLILFCLKVSLSGVTLDRRGFRPADTVFAVSGHRGIESRYTYWSFEGEDTERAVYTEAEMKSLGALTRGDGGQTILDQSKLIHEDTRIPFRGKYKAERHVTVTCARGDYFPLFQTRIVLKQVVIVRGDILDDLEFSLTQLGSGSVSRRQENRPDGRVELHFESQNVAFPGQASVLSWKPKDAAEHSK